MPTSLLEWALEYVARGWPVLPLYWIDNGDCACTARQKRAKKCTPGKHPLANLHHGVKDATLDPDTVRRWWGPRLWPNANIGVALWEAGLMDISPDSAVDHAEFIARGLPETLTFRSGGGEGHLHFIYRRPAGTPRARLCVPGHFDVMADGYAVFPPSNHISGGIYAWETMPECEVADPPAWGVEMLQLQVQGRTPAASVSVAGDAVLGVNGEPPLDIDRDVWQGKGFDHDHSGGLWAIAGELAAAGANEATIVEALRERDVTLGWTKYTNRSDREQRYLETARRQLANVMPRITLGATTTSTATASTTASATASTATSASTTSPRLDADWPKPMNEKAFYGPLGEFVLQAAKQSEADPAALLGSTMSAASAVMQPNAAARAGDAYHPIRLNSILAGPTGQGRKGSAAKVGERLARLADDAFHSHIVEGLSSGEGLLWQIRDEIKRWNAKQGDYDVIDKGVEDKRLLVVESEFGSTLRILQREGNSLSGIIRRAWDLPPRAVLSTLVKNAPTRATGAHIVITGHVTREELLRYVDRTDLVNGFANRFLWLASRRAHELPFGEEVDPVLVAGFAKTVQAASEWTRADHRMSWAPATRDAWTTAYHDFSVVPRGGMYGAVTARAEAQVLRISALFAALDLTNHIQPKHLEAALAVWDYVERTCAWLFGSTLGDEHADDILVGLRAEGPMNRTQIAAYLGKRVNRAAIERALGVLQAAHLAEGTTTPTGGRPAEVWSAR